MVLKGKKSSFALTVIASSMLVGCNGSDSDPKLESAPAPDKVAVASEISGVALDGYLKNAKVCIDINRNNTCESDDGTIVFTDEQGAFSLAHGDVDLSKHTVLVEAIANKTIDMDSPDTPVQDGFALMAPAGSAAVVSPITTVISVVAAQQGVDYTSAQTLLAKHLGVDSQRLTADYLENTHSQDKHLHAFAQGLTALMQTGEQASVADGVSRLDARKGTQAKLAMLDLAALKTTTDKLVGTVNHTPEQVREAVNGLAGEVSVTREEVDGNQVRVIPSAPTNGKVNDAADTFDWDWVGFFTANQYYEFSTDTGHTWQPVVSKPLVVGSEDYAVGDVQVRIRADHANHIKAGKVLKNQQPFTGSPVPAAPASVTVNDAENHFEWAWVPGYSLAADYEFSTDAGQSWQFASQNPQPVDDVAIAAGALQVRVAADSSDTERLNPGKVAVSQEAFTQTPAQPAKPQLTAVSDETDSVEWDFVEGFTQFNQYEVSFDNGKSWTPVADKPLAVGNREIPAGWLHIRVARNEQNGMPAGLAAVVTDAFTAQEAKPAAPANLRVDDAANTLDWDWVDGFTGGEFYEISLQGISADPAQWNNVGGKPASVPDENFAKGAVCIRVKADVANSNTVGEATCSGAYFTTKPGMPTAPVIDDENDTFGWTLADGYPQLSSYQIKVGTADWLAVPEDGNPYQLEDKDYPAGSIQVRVGSDLVTGRVAGDALVNDIAFTQKEMNVSDVTLLTFDGSVTSKRAEAACARMADGKVWQLFNNADADKRFKAGADIYSELETFTACGVNNWRIPTYAELDSQFTENPAAPELKVFDNSVFAYMEVDDSVEKARQCYLSSDESVATGGEKKCLDISNIEKPKEKSVEDECIDFCLVFGKEVKPLYRFISE